MNLIKSWQSCFHLLTLCVLQPATHLGSSLRPCSPFFGYRPERSCWVTWEPCHSVSCCVVYPWPSHQPARGCVMMAPTSCEVGIILQGTEPLCVSVAMCPIAGRSEDSETSMWFCWEPLPNPGPINGFRTSWGGKGSLQRPAETPETRRPAPGKAGGAHIVVPSAMFPGGLSEARHAWVCMARLRATLAP